MRSVARDRPEVAESVEDLRRSSRATEPGADVSASWQARVWVPAEARWLAAGGLAAGAALVTVDPAPAAVGLAVAVVLTLAGSGGGLQPWRPPRAWPIFIAVATLLAGVAAARWGAEAPAYALIVLLQAAAGLAAPSRRAALGGGLAIAVVVMTAGPAAHVLALAPDASSSLSLAATVASGLASLVGVALAAAAAQLLDALAKQGTSPAPPRLGDTRLRLGKAQRDLAAVTSQLRRESRQRRQAEAQAQAAARTRAAFLGIMSHELRTPLNQIIGYSELLLDEIHEGAPDDAAADVGRIHAASLNLLEMINNVLDLSKLEAGTMTLTLESFDVAELVENVVQGFAAPAHRHGNVIRVRCPADLPPLRSDRPKLRTILANLLSNACKFTRDGTIRIAVEAVDHLGVPSLRVEVSDTGIGIPPDQIDRLFAAFVQADGSSTRRHDGSGLGLAIVHDFCALLGGEIAVTSAPGTGSCFVVRVPREFVDPRRAGHVLTSLAP